MRKWHAQALVVLGIIIFVAGLYLIWVIFDTTREMNSQENPPSWWVLFTLPFCSGFHCDITHTLAWNLMAVLMSLGLVMIVVGILQFNKITRKYAVRW